MPRAEVYAFNLGNRGEKLYFVLKREIQATFLRMNIDVVKVSERTSLARQSALILNVN